jgi:hypothetical protein
MRGRRDRERRQVGIRLSELSEESRFGAGARREIIRWFPDVRWVQALDENPRLRELAIVDRRRFLACIGLLPLAALPAAASLSGCSAATAGLIFQAVQMAASYFATGSPSSGNALFDNGSQSREAFQMLTSLFAGKPSGEKSLKDENQFDVQVPASATGYMHFFSDLLSDETGDHYVAGKAIGQTKLSDLFEYK